MEKQKVKRVWHPILPIEITGMSPEAIKKAEAIWFKEWIKDNE